MKPTKLEYADQRMRQKWHDLVMAEQQGASMQQLERMYNAYILAVEEYNRCSAQFAHESGEQTLPIPVQSEPEPVNHAPTTSATSTSSMTVRNGRQKKKAS
jgi:hypothetical protein